MALFFHLILSQHLLLNDGCENLEADTKILRGIGGTFTVEAEHARSVFSLSEISPAYRGGVFLDELLEFCSGSE